MKKILSENEKNAALCNMTLEEYESHIKEFDDFHDKIIAVEKDPKNNKFEGWTQEEIDHFEDKFFKQPFDAISAEAMGLIKETEKAPPLDFEDVF